MDPLTKSFPWWTPYQFAGNRPIQAIDLDGLEFYKYNEAYVSIGLMFDPATKKITAAEISLRYMERQLGSTDFILPGDINAMIDLQPVDELGGHDSRIELLDFTLSAMTAKSLVKTSDDAEMSDIDNENATGPVTIYMRKYPHDNTERREQIKKREFWTPVMATENAKASAIVAAVEYLGVLGQKAGLIYLNSVLKEAKVQGEKARLISVLIQDEIDNPKGELVKYLDNYSISQVANYLLYGREIVESVYNEKTKKYEQKRNEELTNIAKKIWKQYEARIKPKAKAVVIPKKDMANTPKKDKTSVKNN